MAIEPLYTLDVACELIPISKYALEHILSRRADEFEAPLFHMLMDDGKGKGCHQVRMLRESECLKVRNMVIKSPTGPRRAGLRREPGLNPAGMGHGVTIVRE